MSAPASQYYISPEWLELSKAVRVRDGHSCRNCGAGDHLEVHHWLPLPEHQRLVDQRGYAKVGNPLIVHESGLVTLCRECHSALTERRTRQAILSRPELRKLAVPDRKSDNVFELWALNDKRVPFNVCKDTWSLQTAQFYQVERIEITKWPYGHAWGRYVRDGVEGDYGKIPNAGTYSWRLIEV